MLQYRRDVLLRECDLFEVRVAAGVVDLPHGGSSCPRVRLMRQPCYDGRERLMAMHCGNSTCTCRECGAGVGNPRIVKSGARVPRSDSIWMVVGLVAVAGASHACSEAGTQRFRRASAAPDTKGKKLGGGARASPPHKTLSGFDIQLQYTRSEPAINQLGEEFYGCLRRGIGAGDGEHGPDVIGKGAEPCRRLACECGPLGHALV